MFDLVNDAPKNDETKTPTNQEQVPQEIEKAAFANWPKIKELDDSLKQVQKEMGDKVRTNDFNIDAEIAKKNEILGEIFTVKNFIAENSEKLEEFADKLKLATSAEEVQDIAKEILEVFPVAKLQKA